MFPFTLHQLRILRAVAAEQSFTKAAETLYLSQPSLSKQLKILEDSLGILLINRNKKQRFLTEHGELLLRYAERILALCEESCRVISDSKNGERGNLILGATPLIATYVFPKLFRFYSQKYPGITLNFQVFSTELIASQIIAKAIDIAILDEETLSTLQRLGYTHKLKIRPIIVESIDLIVPKAHPFASRKKIPKSALYSLKYVSLAENDFEKRHIDKLLKSFRVEIDRLDNVATFQSLENVKLAVTLGLGSAFIPRLVMNKDSFLKKNNLRRVEIQNFQMTRKYYMINSGVEKKFDTYQLICSELKEFNINS